MIRSFDGKTPRIAKSAFVSEAAYVVGDVEIGENSGIWPGTIVRGDFARIKIGANTMIEDGCIVHCGSEMEIGDNVLIGHGVVVHGTRIGSNTLIGNNATILDGAQIGRFCVIGAGCLVSQEMVIPDNSFVVGVPGKIRGQVSQERRERLLAGPGSYVEMAKRYKEQGL
jgi:carbonic anhydrase/acetyltransferase-like protein (isoleucine patch superfamily)